MFSKTIHIPVEHARGRTIDITVEITAIEEAVFNDTLRQLVALGELCQRIAECGVQVASVTPDA